LKRIEFQLTEVFGPLRGFLLQTQSAFTLLLKRHKWENDVGGFFAHLKQTDASTTEQTLTPVQRDWIFWLKYILQPANREVANIIMTKSSGFTVMPKFLANLTSHIAEHDVILAKIEEGKYDHLVSTTPWEDRMGAYVHSEYQCILNRKNEILKDMEHEHKTKQKSADEYDGDGEGIKLNLVSGGDVDVVNEYQGFEADG
jgi:hypothetical protein